MKMSVIVPCYNEKENIPLILERFRAAITDEDIEVILVNNGSTDGSSEVLSRLLPEYPFARTTLVEVNQGYGYGILHGLEAAEGEFLGWTHADLQTDPSDLVKAYHMLEEKRWAPSVYVKGTRRGRSPADNFFTTGMSAFETLYLGRRLYDINAQPNIFSRAFFESWENPPHDFSLDLYALYMARVKGQEVLRFPVEFPPRLHGSSHWNTGLASKWKFIKRTIQFSTKLKREGIR